VTSGDITLLLGRIERGDPQAADELLPLVYDELRRLAAARMAREAAGQTLQPSAPVSRPGSPLPPEPGRRPRRIPSSPAARRGSACFAARSRPSSSDSCATRRCPFWRSRS
jgi:hypothetical protein